MPVLADFQPEGRPGEAAALLRDSQQSWMQQADRTKANALQRQQAEQDLLRQRILMPVIQAKARADVVQAKTQYDGALRTQDLREQSYKLYDQAGQDFDALNLIPDDKLRAQASREWLSRYSQLENIAELKGEMAAKNHLATANIMNSVKLDMLGGAAGAQFDRLTEGFTPEEKDKAKRVKTGIAGRASGAAKQYKIVTGFGGAPSLVALDPNEVRAEVVGTGETYADGKTTPATQQPGEGGQSTFTGQTTKDKARDTEAGKQEADYAANLQKTKPKRQMALKQAEITSGRLTQDIDDLIGKVNSTTAGPGGVVMDHFPGTSARDLASNLDSIKANIGFQALQAMREASPTGGALGQVSDVENKLLQAQLGSLQVGQSPDQLIKNLKKVRQRISENFGIVRSAFDNEYGNEDSGSQGSSWDDAKEARLLELKAKLGK